MTDPVETTDTVEPTTTVVVRPAEQPATAQLITNANRLTLNESLAKIERTRIVGGQMIPEYLSDDQSEGLDMMGDMVKPLRLRVVQSLSKSLKEAGFSDGDAVLVPINVKVGDKANPLNAVVLLSWAEYLCLNPRNCGQFWIRESTTDARSEIAQKVRKYAKDRKLEKELLPEGGKDSKGNLYTLEYVKACNFILWLTDHNIACMATWMKGEQKYGEAFSSLVQARGLSVYTGHYQLSVQTRTNASNESWDGLSAGNSPSNAGWCLEAIKESMKGMHQFYRDQWAAQNIDAGYDDMTEPQAGKVNTDEF